MGVRMTGQKLLAKFRFATSLTRLELLFKKAILALQA
jgi:hypothetical protein